MSRPKGSKNKPKSAEVKLDTAAAIEQVKGEIEQLKQQLADKKRELKALEDALELEKQKQLMDAIAASGKSVEEVLAFLNGTQNGGVQ